MARTRASYVRIRPFRIADSADICRIYPTFFVDNAIHVRGGRLTIAEIGGRVVGFVLWAPALEPAWFDPGVEKWAELQELHVHLRFQNRGLGTRLVQTAIRQARSAGYRTLFLTAEASNAPARRVYEKCGFREQSWVVRYKLSP
jgi:ribosomal protein S18 acetylase RimI-like enzyme